MPSRRWNPTLALCVVLTTCVVGVLGNLNCDLDSKDTEGLPNDACAFNLSMKGARPKKSDQYMCSGYSVAEDIYGVTDKSRAEGYIVKFEALAEGGMAHHILVYGCSRLKAQHRTGPWDCGSICDGGKEQIVFAWAKHADPLYLPKDVGRHIGVTAEIDYLVVQIHYARKINANETSDYSGIRIYTTQHRQPYIAGIYLLLAYDAHIKANTQKTVADISCSFNWADSIVPFGYRTHAHSLGVVISAYRVYGDNYDKYERIGKGNPQWPQAFYPVDHFMKIQPQDKLAARCTYNSIGRDRDTFIGSKAKDEMCNFYIMYYTNATSEKSRGYDTCAGNNQPSVFKNIPAGSDTPLPRNEDLEDDATGHPHHHHAMTGDTQDDDDDDYSVTTSPETDIIPDLGQIINGNTRKQNGNLNNGKGRFSFGQNSLNGVGNKLTQGKSAPISTSYGDDLLHDQLMAGRQFSDISHYGQDKPQNYLFDYEPDYPINDYYDVMRQRNRNKVRKPYYELYDTPKRYGFSDFSDNRNDYDKGYPTLSRNRNKIFNAKYDEYADNDEIKKSHTKQPQSKMAVSIKIDNSAGIEESTKGDHSHSTKDSSGPLTGHNSDLDLKFISEVGKFELGQVGGVAVNNDGELHIFHRGSRVWDSLSFSPNNVYQQTHLPVNSDAVIILNKDSTLKRSFGKGSYYLPHGLSLDHEGNMWLTDVALHQVFKINRGGTTPNMTLGVQFEPGSDNEHFCKPADVAVLPSGEFFVADGYCNTRIMKFDANGYLIKQWGTASGYQASGFAEPGTFNLPHGLTLAEDKGLVCVADRENGRIQCFDLEGKFVRQMHPPQFGQTLYALEYCPKHGGIIFAVNGPGFGAKAKDVVGLTLNINNGQLISTWNIPDQGLTHPHDVAVDTERHLVYVGELRPSKVWKFEMTKALYSANKTNGSPSVTVNKPIDKTINVAMATSSPLSEVDTSMVTLEHVTPPPIHVVNTHPFYPSNIGPHDQHKKIGTQAPLPNIETHAPPKKIGTHAPTQNIERPTNSQTIDVVEEGPQIHHIEESEGFAPSLIIGMLLVIPVILLIIVTVLIRLYHTGYFGNCHRRSGKKAIFNLGNFLNSHKGFDRLSTEDDDHDLENALDDSDNEEFSIVRKA